MIRFTFTAIALTGFLVSSPCGAAGADPDAEAQSFLELAARETDRAYRGGGEAAANAMEGAFLRFEESGFHALLAGRDPELYRQVEAAWLGLASSMRGGAKDPAALGTARDAFVALVSRARRVVGGGASGTQLFVESLVILLREGFEAILVLGAIIAYLRKIGRRDAMRPLYAGALAALAASVGLFVLAQTTLPISGQHQELLEGVTMLVAVVVLFWVSYWLISKAEGSHWQKFIRGKVQEAVTAGGLWGFGSLAFLVVFREGFETILFYRALVSTTGGEAAGQTAVAGGVAAAAVLLVILYVGIVHLGVKIPIRAFFGVTGALLYYLAFKFAGTGVREMQDARVVAATPLGWIPDVPSLQTWLGVFPTVETTMAQALLLLAAVGGLVWSFAIAPFREPAEAGRAPGRVPLWAVGILITLSGAALATTVGLMKAGEKPPAPAPGGPAAVPLDAPPPYKGRKNPLPDTPETVARGQGLFTKSCLICHGPKGEGNGPAAAGLNPPPANYAKLPPHDDDWFFWRVSEGKPKTPMMGFKSTLPEEDRWAVIRYVRQLQRAGGAK